MVKKWEFEGEVDISTGPFSLILWNAEKSDYEVVGIRALCQREKLEGKKVKITVETLDGEVDKMDEDVEAFEKMDVVDRISTVIHEEWMEWSKSISDIESYNQLILKVNRWEELWIPYGQLSEELKEKDREYARKIIRAFEYGGEKMSENKDVDGMPCEKFVWCLKEFQKKYGEKMETSKKLIKRRAKYFEKMAEESKTLGWIKGQIDEFFDDWEIESAYAFAADMVKYEYPFDTQDAGGNFDEKVKEVFGLSPLDFGFIDQLCTEAEKRFSDDVDIAKKKTIEERRKEVQIEDDNIFNFPRLHNDAKWLDENLIHFYEIVKGKTIAAKDEKILAMADDMDDLVRQLKEKGEDPGMIHTTYIPKEDDDIPLIL